MFNSANSPNCVFLFLILLCWALLQVWDIRSSIPLHTVRVFPKLEKGLCLTFGQDAKVENGGVGNSSFSLYLGGSDGVVKHFTTKN